MAAAGLAVDEGILELGNHDVDAAEAATTRLLLESADPPTAVFTLNNRNTVGALRAILAHAPDTALVGFDDFELADLLGRPVTVVHHDPAEMGRLAAELLFKRINGDARPPRRRLIRTTLVMRGSGEISPGGRPT
jgi:LacI family transcriptional regulator